MSYAPPPSIAMPRQGIGRISRRPEELLLLCFYEPTGISTVPELVAYMQAESSFSVTVINLHEHRQDNGFLKLSPSINLKRFAGVVIHNSVSYNVDNLRSLDSVLPLKLKDYSGAKILMKQDENHHFRKMAQYIGEVGFDLVFTCLPAEAVDKVYPAKVVGKPRFERMLTGYVTPTLRATPPNVASRPIDIGYRGSIQPLSFGRLAYEKRRIGEDVNVLLADRGLTLDISSRWEDRIGNEAWLRFLRACKATLGTESGASVFDLQGDLDARCADAEARLGPLREDADYAEEFLKYLEDLEGNVHYHQISPRHFEAIAMGTIQLLFPGDYSGLLVPFRHYFPLARDYTNLDAAIALVNDERRRSEMAETAFKEVILNPDNWIETFVKRFDALTSEAMRAKGVFLKPVLEMDSGKNVLLIAAHEPRIDPRLGWIEGAARGGLRVHQLGVLPPEVLQSKVEISPRGNLVLSHPRVHWRPEICNHLLAQVGSSPAGMAGVQELMFLNYALQLPDRTFCEIFGAPPGCERNAQFRWYLRHLLDTAATLLDQASRMRGVHALIAADLDTMPAALVLKGIFGVPVFYDAHEYWPEADFARYEYETQFWIGLERRMVAHADYRQTISPGLTKYMTAQYGVSFEVVPNCEPADSLLPLIPRQPRADGMCHFLYQGRFAAGRGIDLLIQAWPDTEPDAILLLRGPDNPCKQDMRLLATRTGLLNTRIFFPEPVQESQLVTMAAAADVGLIPYTPAGVNYSHCCPKKLSQYMAAGLPILANETSFVATTITAAGCGKIVSFARRSDLLNKIAVLTRNPDLRSRLGRAGRDYFSHHFNWNVVSQNFYENLDSATKWRNAEPFQQFSAVSIISSAEPIVRALRRLWRTMSGLVKNVLRPIARHLR